MQWMNSVSVRLMAWVITLLPLTMAVLFHTGLRSVPLSIEVPRRPSLAFHQYGVDLRRPRSVAEASYVFQNRGSEPVHITKIEPSCGCLTVRLQGAREDIIEAGDHARIVAQMQLANSTPGPHEYAINVSYTDPEPREVQLTLKMEIPATIWVTPASLIFYHPAGSTEPTLAEFKVTDGRGKRFEITDVSVNTDLVEPAIGETSRTENGNFQQTVQVSVAAKLPAGRSQVMLRIATTDPEIPLLQVPIILQGEATPNDAEGDRTLDHETPKHRVHSSVDAEVIRSHNPRPVDDSRSNRPAAKP